jgi:hypothetical protein
MLLKCDVASKDLDLEADRPLVEQEYYSSR